MRAAAALVLACAVSSARCIPSPGVALPDTTGFASMIVVVEPGDPAETAVEAVALGDGVARPFTVRRDGALVLLLFEQPLSDLKLAPGRLELAPSGACGIALPSAAKVWSAKLGSDRPSPWSELAALPPEVEALRRRPTRGACPRLDAGGALSVEVGCTSILCHTRVEQSDCALSIDLGTCSLGVVAGEVGALGELCVTPSHELGACVEAPTAEGERRLACSAGAAAPSCEIALHPPSPRPTFRTERVRVLDVAPSDGAGFERPPEGWLGDLAILDGVIAVVGWKDDPSIWNCPDDTERGVLVLLDPDTLAPLSRTATLPPCLSQIAPDPLSDGFLAIYGEAALGRFDRTGRLVAQVDVPADWLTPARRASSLIVLEGSPPIAAASFTNAAFAADGAPSLIFSVDLERFAPLPRSEPMGKVRELAPYGRQMLAIDDAYRGLLFLDPTTGASRPGPTLFGAFLEAVAALGQPSFHAQSSRFIVSAAGPSGGLFAYTPATKLWGHAVPYERYADAWAVVPWPRDPSLLLVGLSDIEGNRTGSVALVDPAAGRFLPGAQEIGHGPPGRFHVDRRGRVLAVMPWTGELVIISAAAP